jgi:hypothetical protein
VLLLSVAIVDDAITITLIAALLTENLSLLWLAAGLGLCAVYRVALTAGFDRTWLVWFLAIAVWVAIHASGVHATVAGVLLGILTPVRPRKGEAGTPGARFERALLPFSAGFAVPVFALAATGISLGAATGALHDEIAVGVFCGLLIGQSRRRLRWRSPRRRDPDRRAADRHYVGRCAAGGGARVDRLHGQSPDRAAHAAQSGSAGADVRGRAGGVGGRLAGGDRPVAPCDAPDRGRVIVRPRSGPGRRAAAGAVR